MRQRFVIGLVVLSLAGVWTTAAAGEPAPQATLGKWGIETDSFSTTVKPGDDFYLYVNEGWLKTAKIPVGLDSYDDPTKLYLVITSGMVTADRITSSAASADWARLVISGGTLTANEIGIGGSQNVVPQPMIWA